jgi:hypothetical protein
MDYRAAYRLRTLSALRLKINAMTLIFQNVCE